jgi:hypothetical protein
MNTLTDLGFKAGPYLIILSMLVLGMQHFYFADPIMVGGFSVPLIPGRAVWAYFTGISRRRNNGRCYYFRVYHFFLRSIGG